MTQPELAQVVNELASLQELHRKTEDARAKFGAALDVADQTRRTVEETAQKIREAIAKTELYRHPDALAVLQREQSRLERFSRALHEFCEHDKRPGRLGGGPRPRLPKEQA